MSWEEIVKKYPHKMWSPKGKMVIANTKEEHEKYMSQDYTHSPPKWLKNFMRKP